jgi:CRISPR-associated endonuclease Csn1
MQINDMFLLGLNENEIDCEDQKLLSAHLYRVQKISKMNYMFRHHLASTLDKKDEEVHVQSLGRWEELNPIKVRLTPSGKIEKL